VIEPRGWSAPGALKVVRRGNRLRVTCWHRITKTLEAPEPWISWAEFYADLNPCKTIMCGRHFTPRR
jgi:hypothetical protein